MEATVSAHVLSTAKKGHVTQCLAVAELLGIEIQEVIQARGINKAWPRWRQEVDKLKWLVTALRMAWNFRGGKNIIFSSGRSVLPATRLIKLLRGNQCLVLHIGSPKHWKRRCADIVLRFDHEREPGVDEDTRYPWNPHQIWVSAPICLPLPTTDTDNREVTVLMGGLNITYGDDVKSYSALLAGLDSLVQKEVVNIVFSRRTKADVVEAVKQRYGQTGARLIKADDQQGFMASCENAGVFLVTPDSITMVAEAYATGKSVYVADITIKRTDTRNFRFIDKAIESGQVQVFEGEIDFDRRQIDRSDVDEARATMLGIIADWKEDPSSLSG